MKREPHGAASEYLHTGLRVGDVIEAGAPRGSFVLRPGDRPVVLISAGVGATPVLAMLHVLAGGRSARQVWWLHGARNRAEHAVRAGGRLGLLAQLPDAHRIVCYSHPGPHDRGFDVAGRLTGEVLEQAGVPTDADFYLCGPGRSCTTSPPPSIARGAAPERISTEVFGPADAITPGIADGPARSPHPPAGAPGAGPIDLVQPQQPVGRVGSRPSRACSSSRRPATSRSGGRAGRASVTRARPGSSAARSATGPTRSNRPRRAPR